jgi:hypothetical protein
MVVATRLGEGMAARSANHHGRSRDGAKLGVFTILRTAQSGEVFRGLDWAPSE